MDVTVLERRPAFGPRVCGAFLDAEAIRHLDSLGLKDKARALGVDVLSARVSVGSGNERALALPVPGLALPRPELERILIDAMVQRGGNLRWGVIAQPEEPNHAVYPPPRVEEEGVPKGAFVPEGRMRGSGRRRVLLGTGIGSGETHVFSADLVIWADGRFSGQGPPAIKKGPPAWFGWNAVFKDVDQLPGEMSLHFLPDGYVGLLTFKDGTSNLCGLKRRRGTPLDWETVFNETKERSPSLQRRMERATPLSPWRGVGPLPFTHGLRPDDGRIRVGDAAAVGDPFMGEGIGRALGSGPLLAQALRLSSSGNDSFYEIFRRLWRTSYGRRFQLGNILRWFLNHPRVSIRALDSLLARPMIARFLLPLFHGGFRTGK